MRDLLSQLDRWVTEGREIAVARLVAAEGSTPRLPGAALAVTRDGEVAGSVSGGCVESAVVAEALEVLDSGERRLLSVDDEDGPLGLGLTCGGTVHVFVEPLADAGLEPVLRALSDRRPIALATVVTGPGAGAKLVVDAGGGCTGSLGNGDLDRVVARDASATLVHGGVERRHYGPRGQARQHVVDVVIEAFAAPSRFVIFGAVDFTAALAAVAKFLGFHVTVCDARAVFTTPERFPEADEVVVEWPHRWLAAEGADLGPTDAVCVLTHDPKFDVPAIVAALATDVGYLGAMGSRRTHAARVRRLQDEGVSEVDLERLLAPIGLDIGARTPQETAIAICGEIIGRATGHTAGSLRAGHGPIH